VQKSLDCSVMRLFMQREMRHPVRRPCRGAAAGWAPVLAAAIALGAAELPGPVRLGMRAMAKMMTTVAYRV